MLSLFKKKKLPQLPKEAWTRIILWLPPISAIKSKRICKMCYDITFSLEFWHHKYRFDFHGVDLQIDYKLLIRELNQHKQLTKLSFGFRTEKIRLFDRMPAQVVMVTKDVHRLNLLKYRNKSPLKIKKIADCYHVQCCERCGSTNIVIWGEYSYVDCHSCYTSSQYNIGSKAIYTGRFHLEISRPKTKNSCCNII